MRPLSREAENLLGQPMFAILAKVKEAERQGKEIIHFEIGDPKFDTPPHIVRAVEESLRRGETHYGDSMGLWELREEVVRTTEKTLGFKPSIDQVLVSPANAVIDFLVRSVANPGDEIIYPDPGFPTYIAVIKYAGMTPVPVALREENQFRMNPKDIEAAITDKTRLIIINSPNNPTGAVMTAAEIQQVAKIAQARGIYLLSDEVYTHLRYSDEHHSPSAYDHCKEYTIVLQSFSKTYAMTGWRLGYAVGPAPLMAKMGLMLQTILSCLPTFTQRAGIAALQGPIDQNMLIEIHKRREALIAGLNTLPGVTCLYPEGAFYAFANITGTGLSSDEFVDRMLARANVALVGGNAFGKAGEGYVRLSYSSVTLEEIDRAIIAMRNVLE